MTADRDMAKNWRGRRLMACRAISSLTTVIDSVGKEEPGAEALPADRPQVAVNEAARRAMHKQADALLRMILLFNDGG